MSTREYHAAYYRRNKEKKKSSSKRYYKQNKEKMRAAMRRYSSNRPERITVNTHFQLIFNPKSRQHRNYKGMPFFSDWNPRNGGSFDAAEKWIIQNLGKRPRGTSLHIVDPLLGFVPNNLEWTERKRQNREQLIKIIARLRHKIKKLESELAKDKA